MPHGIRKLLAPRRRGRRAARYALGVLAVATVLGAQAAPAYAADRATGDRATTRDAAARDRPAGPQADRARPTGPPADRVRRAGARAEHGDRSGTSDGVATDRARAGNRTQAGDRARMPGGADRTDPDDAKAAAERAREAAAAVRAARQAAAEARRAARAAAKQARVQGTPAAQAAARQAWAAKRAARAQQRAAVETARAARKAARQAKLRSQSLLAGPAPAGTGDRPTVTDRPAGTRSATADRATAANRATAAGHATATDPATATDRATATDQAAAADRAGKRRAATTARGPGDDARLNAVPTGVGAEVDADLATVTITWTLPDGNDAQVGFRLNGAVDRACAETTAAPGAGSCELTGVAAGEYTVEYREDAGAWTDAGASADVPVAPPGNVTATASVHGLTVDWDASPSPGVTYLATATPIEPGAENEPGSCATAGCTIDDLAYQAYSVSVVATSGELTSEPATIEQTPLPEVPPTPTGITGTASASGTITITWNAVSSDYGVDIRYMAGIATDNWGQGCADEPFDALTCEISGLPVGQPFSVVAFAVGDVMSERGVAARKVTIPLPATAPDGPSMDSDLGGDEPQAGSDITISGDGYLPFSTVVLAFFSEPLVLGRATADANGAFSATVTLPAGYLGDHTIAAIGVDPSGNPRTMTLAVSIAAAGGSAGGDGTLPVTGSPVALLLLLGAALVTVGGGAVYGTRPRRPRAAVASH